MENYNPCEPDTTAITPVDERVAIYQLLTQQTRGEIDFLTDFHAKLNLWARHGFQFGRDNEGNIVMIEPVVATT